MSEHGIVYRPEIDGLRAVAVLAIFIFHLNHQWLPGGFVGVDIFFVISGYLITMILYRECNIGKFSFAQFYQRRIARIFPAFFVVGIATVASAALVYSTLDFASSGAGLVASSLSVANMKFMIQGNYFELSPDAQPFLHYWSLSVEEQFYLIFPAFLYILFCYVRRQISLVLLLCLAGSLLTCIKITQFNPVWAFFLLPTRAWEFLAGSLLATMPLLPINRFSGRIANLIPLAGLTFIGCSFFVISEGLAFPGWQAFFPAMGAAMVLFPGVSTRSLNMTKKILSLSALVVIGRLSYSLYLWHWPVFSLVDYQFLFSSNESRLVMKIGISFLLAFMSFKFIETPARKFLNQRRFRSIAFGGFLMTLILCIGLGFFIRKTQHINATFDDVANGGLLFSVIPGPSSVVLMGDSNGSMYGVAIQKMCKELGLNLTVISSDAGDPLPNRSDDSNVLWLSSVEVIKKTRPKYLVIANEWSGKLGDDRQRLEKAIEMLRPFTSHIVILNQPPILPRELTRASIRNGLRPPFIESKEAQIKRHETNEYLLGLQSKDVTIVDIARRFESNDGNIIVFDGRQHMLYQDSTHLSGYGAERVSENIKAAISTP